MSKARTANELGIPDVAWVVSDVYQIKVDHTQGDEAYFLCVAHDDRKPSASVNLKTGWWACWSCAAGGDLIDLGRHVFGASRMQVELMLEPDNPAARRQMILRACNALRRRNEPAAESEAVVDRIPAPEEFEPEPLDYMRNRGFNDRILQKFGVRYGKEFPVLTKNAKSLKMTHTICIPIYDADGELVSWCFRATPKSKDFQPRYFYPTGTSLSEILFAENLMIEESHKSVCVTEGPIDAMWLWQAGYPSVATFGAANARKSEKIEALSNFRQVTIFGDRNDAGIKFANSLGELLVRHTSVRIARYQRPWQGTDPNTLTISQVRTAVERAIPFHGWKLSI